MSNHTLLPDGSELILRTGYTSREDHGVAVLVVISSCSFTAVIGLLLAISVSAFNTRSWNTDKHPHLFVRSQVAAYFISLLLSDLVQTLGSILNVKWIGDRAVAVGEVCTVQGILKQIADVSTAIWTLIIAIHTFSLVCLGYKWSRFTFLAVLVLGWSGIATIVIAGPASQTSRHGSFYGISGYWCWISAGYPTSRIVLDYLFMFMAAGFSFVLYTLVFLRLRGNIVFEGRHISFRRTGLAWRGGQNRAVTLAKQMLVAAVYLLSGIVNVTVFTMTRRILPPASLKIPRWGKSCPQPMSEYTIETTANSYHMASVTYPEPAGAKERGHPSDTDLVGKADVSKILAPPPRSHRMERNGAYNVYARDKLGYTFDAPVLTLRTVGVDTQTEG
ncbi:Git3 domain-containing protein [Mycena sanguinolenta]|uniref:Git3 domain-containing protein n=1 Tax=Mycena sanguinolenta TaxID=230812 RepID=A0A8H6XB30_9AGAR|nr:Git3 domain-containing protein [Mycena sanguinolenta]